MTISPSFNRTSAALTLGAIALAVALGLVVMVYSGLYSVAADEPHYLFVSNILDQLRDRSVSRHARDVVVPNLEDPAMIAEGAEHYSGMCTGCHLAPGVTDSEIRTGLYPQPPNLAIRGIGDPKAVFWTIKHGIKMSGMPAWGTSHEDEAIWNIVAFLRKMPSMSPEAYQALIGTSGENPESGTPDHDKPHDPSPDHDHSHAHQHDHGH